MAKGQQRSNKETKKPKKAKPKNINTGATSSTGPAKPSPFVRGKK